MRRQPSEEKSWQEIVEGKESFANKLEDTALHHLFVLKGWMRWAAMGFLAMVGILLMLTRALPYALVVFAVDALLLASHTGYFPWFVSLPQGVLLILGIFFFMAGDWGFGIAFTILAVLLFARTTANLSAHLSPVFKNAFELLPIAGGLFFVILGIAWIFWGKASTSWPTTEGIILESRVIESTTVSTTRRGHITSSITYTPHVVYRYRVAGKSYKSDRICFGALDESTWSIVNRYPVGKKVKVHYNPKDPGDSVLEPGSMLSGNLIFIGMGLVTVLIFGRGWRRRRALRSRVGT